MAKSAEDYIKQIIRIALKLQDRIKRGDYSRAIRLLQLISKIDDESYRKIRKETQSPELAEKCKDIKEAAEKALKDVKQSNFEGVNKAIKQIIAGGEEYLRSEEKWVGTDILRFRCRSIDEQARYMANYIDDLSFQQAKLMLDLTYKKGFDLVIGGSTLKNNKIGLDLDLGFKIDKRYKNMGLEKTIKDEVIFLVEQINKRCFPGFYRKHGKFMVEHKWIYDKHVMKSIPDIEDVQEFFMRKGFRKEPEVVIKDGKPFGPSGFMIFYVDGTVKIAKPRIEKGTLAGIRKFW
jgi:hypothetical protein